MGLIPAVLSKECTCDFFFALLCCLQVCGHISKCYSVAAQFEECREKITEMPGIIKDLCRVLYFGKVEFIFNTF